jgi:GTP-binding protein
VDVRFEKDGKTIVAIDTAGLRKTKRMVSDSIEFYSYVRATRSVRRADVVLLLIDSTVPVGQVDKKIVKFIADEHKACILVVNKWDLAKGKATTGDYEEYLTKTLPGLRHAPIAFTTATERKNVQSLLDLAAELFKQASTWLTTGKLNRAFEAVKAARGGGVKLKKGRPKIYYATQIAINPVTILMFVNKPGLFDSKYKKFIINKLREVLSIDEVPIRLLARAHRE